MIKYREGRTLTDLVNAWALLRTLDNYYPDFEYWFVNTAMPSVMVGNDVLLIAESSGVMLGIALGRRSEPKLRCVRVCPQSQKTGLGIHLIEKMLILLNDEKPRCTVSEELLHLYGRPLVNHFDFSLTSVARGMYRKHKLEYVFN
jgi:hypothetical protein